MVFWMLSIQRFSISREREARVVLGCWRSAGLQGSAGLSPEVLKEWRKEVERFAFALPAYHAVLAVNRNPPAFAA
jgi:hypothetical protein